MNVLMFYYGTVLNSRVCVCARAVHAVLQASMWPSIPLVVPQATLGTAMGLATSTQMVGIGVSNLVVGQILGTKSR